MNIDPRILPIIAAQPWPLVTSATSGLSHGKTTGRNRRRPIVKATSSCLNAKPIQAIIGSEIAGVAQW